MATRVVDLGSVMGPQGLQGLQGPAGKDGKGGRAARLVVGTSKAGWTAADCDYLCDGSGDEVEINAAIQALPSYGGEVVLLDGTYKVNNAVVLGKDNVTLRGNGPATEVSCSLVWDPTIRVTAGGCTVRDVQVYSGYNTALQVLGDRAAVLNCLLYAGSSADGGLDLCGSGSRVMGNLCQGEWGTVCVAGSGHVVMGNIAVSAVQSSAANSAVANNVVLPWEEE